MIPIDWQRTTDTSNRLSNPFMKRLIAGLTWVCVALVTSAMPAHAQTSPGLVRGPGMYLNLLILVPVLLIFLLWVFTTHWVEEDTRELNNVRYEMWNSIAFLSGALGLLL